MRDDDVRGSQKKRTRAAKRRACEISLGCTYALRKTEAYARAGRGPVSRDDRKRFFASFDFFPALWVPTISEHLLALSLLKRSAHLRDSKEKNTRDFEEHTSRRTSVRAREYYATKLRPFLYLYKLHVTRWRRFGNHRRLSRTNEQFIFLRRDGAAFDHFYWSEKCKRDVYSIQRRLRGIFASSRSANPPSLPTAGSIEYGCLWIPCPARCETSSDFGISVICWWFCL